MSCCLQGFPLPSLTGRLYHPSFLAGILDYLICPYRAIVDNF